MKHTLCCRQSNYNPLTVHLPEESISHAADRSVRGAHGQSRDDDLVPLCRRCRLRLARRNLWRRQVIPFFLIPLFCAQGLLYAPIGVNPVIACQCLLAAAPGSCLVPLKRSLPPTWGTSCLSERGGGGESKSAPDFCSKGPVFFS